MSAPALLTVISVFFNMAREAPRSLHSLSVPYQQGVTAAEYRVVVIDHGSTPPLDPALVTGCGPNFSLHRVDPAPVSPVAAINQAVAAATTPYVMILIDGAHLLSPGVVRGALEAFRVEADGFVATLPFHLGPKPQFQSSAEGYDQAEEDRLLADIGWPDAGGYRLFLIASPSDAREGWFCPLWESNCFALRRDRFLAAGGFHPGFSSPGGGMVNLDFLRQRLLEPDLPFILLLGEGSFHQLHTHKTVHHPELKRQGEWQSFTAEYRAIRGEEFALAWRPPLLIGRVPMEAMPHVAGDAQAGLRFALSRNGA